MKIRTLVLGFGLLMLVHLTNAQSGGDSGASEWKANWLWTSEKGRTNTWVAFRKKLDVGHKPKSAITKIAAENKYWLYVNDVLVVRDGGLDGRPDLANTYYDEIDLAPYLKTGTNIIGALVWYKGGAPSYSQRCADQGGFLFQSKLSGRVNGYILSDNTWKAIEHPAFGKTIQLTNPSDKSYKWVAWPISFDASKDLVNWTGFEYNDKNWAKATVKGTPPVAPWNKLVHRTIPFFKDFGLTPYLNQSDVPKTVTVDGVIEGKLKGNIQGTPFLKVNAPAGVKIRIVLNDFYHQEYITKAGVQEFECFAWQNSSNHTVRYEFSNVTGSVDLLDLKFRESSYNAIIIGKFSSNDQALNTLWTKCKNTSLVCMRDIYYDCPNRERGQWWGDVSEQILYSFCLYDSASNLLSRKAYRELMNTQKPDGSLYTTAPGTEFHLPDQNINAVAMLWQYYLYSGDKALLQEVYPQIKKYIGYCVSTSNSDGMLIMQPRVWNWIDWGDNKDIVEGSANTVVNAGYILLLDAVMNIAEAVGQGADKAYYAGLQSKVKKNFNNYFWNSEKSAYVFHRKNNVQSAVIDDRSNAWAVLAGMVDDVKKTSVLNVLNTRYDASPYQEMYVEMAMMQLDVTATLVRMRKRHAAMIESWSSTLWEEFPANNSNNHAWSAGPIYHLSTGVLGIKPEKVKYTEFHFLPKMGDLNEVSGTIPTPYGLIEASCSRSASEFNQTLRVPTGTIGLIGIPKQALESGQIVNTIKAGETIIWEKGKATQAIDGLSFYKEESQYVLFKVQPGMWRFTTL